MTQIGYLGPEGTFTEAAFLDYQSQVQRKLTPVFASSIGQLFKLFNDRQCEEILFPIENSIEGFVSLSMDFLTKTKDSHLTTEITLPIIQHMLVPPGVDRPVTQVLSHPHALAQCQNFLSTTYPEAELMTVGSTAEAALWVSDPSQGPASLRSKHCAAIGNERLADLYQLELRHRNINDHPNNETRFLVLSRTPSLPTGNDKTSLVFSAAPTTPGSLFAVLGEFAKRKINLTHISSRPAKSALGEYRFFIDFVGHADDPACRDALKAITPLTEQLTVLGSYRRG